MFNYLVDKYPEQVKLMKQTEQDIKFHAEGNVFIHTKMVFEALINLEEFKQCNKEEQQILIYAAFFHDIGKHKTSHFEDNHIRSHGHSRVGMKITQGLLYLNGYNFNFRKEVTSLIRYHGFPVFALEKKDYEIAKLSLVLNTKLLYILSKADMLGRISDKESIENSLLNIEYFKDICIYQSCFGVPKLFASNEQKMFYLENGYLYEPYKEKASVVYLLSGLPGSGKDYEINNSELSCLPVISLDNMRREKKVRHNDAVAQGQIIQEAKALAKKHLAQRVDFVWNATNISSSLRQSLITLFRNYGAYVNIMYVEVPYKKLLKQNSNREYPISEKAINELIKKLDIPNELECHEVTYIIKDF